MEHTPIAADTAAETPAPADVVAHVGQRQFTVFIVDGETFGVGLEEVKEIIRLPEVVRVPLAPPSLEGLTNLRGTVLPVVSTRSLFGSPPAAPDDATRVVVLDRGQPIGIVVDRVVSVVAVDAGRIEDAAAVETSLSSDLLKGVVKDEGGLGLVMLLDTARLIDGEFAALGDALRAGGGLADHAPAAAGRRDETLRDPEIQLVSFAVAGQEYALPIQSVREILQLPDTVTRVPRAAASVVGVISLRDRLLPVVSLRALFGLPPHEAGEHDRVAVVSVGEGADALLVGLLLDRVNAVLRVRESTIDPMPTMLAADRNLAEITAICRLEGGQRMVAILSSEAMFDRGAIAAAMEGAEAGARQGEMAMTGTDAGRQALAGDQEQFVVFRLMDEEFGVDIAAVQEIVRVPEDLARVPGADHAVAGVMNLRGAVIPLVDQRARFALPPCEDHDRQRIVVFTRGGVQTGFIVDSVAEVIRVPRRAIAPAPEATGPGRRMIRRIANLPEARRMIMLLDTDRLLDVDAAVAAAA